MTDEDVKDDLVSNLKDEDAKIEHSARSEVSGILPQGAETNFETKTNMKSKVEHTDANISMTCETEKAIEESVLNGVGSPCKEKLTDPKGKQFH